MLTKCPFCPAMVNAADPYNQHICPGPPKSQGFGAQQEMVSLQAIRAALGRIEENQAKLLAGLDVVETVCDALRDELREAREAGRNSNTALSGQMAGGFKAIADEIDGMGSKFTVDFTALFDGNTAVIAKFNEFITNLKRAAQHPAKRRSRYKPKPICRINGRCILAKGHTGNCLLVQRRSRKK